MSESVGARMQLSDVGAISQLSAMNLLSARGDKHFSKHRFWQGTCKIQTVNLSPSRQKIKITYFKCINIHDIFMTQYYSTDPSLKTLQSLSSFLSIASKEC